MKIAEETHKDKIEIVDQAEVKKGLELVKRFFPHKGHTMFEINLITGEVIKAEFIIEESISYNKAKENSKVPQVIAKKIVMKENCKYISALNIQNAMKKLGLGKVNINKK
jgi:hypothetical protein